MRNALIAVEDSFRQKRSEIADAMAKQLADDPALQLPDMALSMHLALWELCIQAVRNVRDEG